MEKAKNIIEGYDNWNEKRNKSTEVYVNYFKLCNDYKQYHINKKCKNISRFHYKTTVGDCIHNDIEFCFRCLY